MQDIDLTPALRKKHGNYPRKRGRYSSSELYGITHGYTSPQNWLNPPEKKVLDMLRMWNGTLVHDHIQRLLPPELSEIKKEHLWNGITLVAKVDHLPKHENTVWEFKSAEEEMAASKESHEYQGKLYCTIFERPQTKIFQPVQSPDHGLFLKHIGTVDRDDVWFQKQLEKLYEFHLKVEELWKAQEAVLGNGPVSSI